MDATKETLQNLIDELTVIRNATHTQSDYRCFTICIEKAKEYLASILSEGIPIEDDLMDVKDLEIIKEARDTLVMASLIDKSNTFYKMVEKLDNLLKQQS